MVGPRMLLGAVVGGALVYFLDPQHGLERRERARRWWERRREPLGDRAGEAGEKLGDAVTELKSRARRRSTG